MHKIPTPFSVFYQIWCEFSRNRRHVSSLPPPNFAPLLTFLIPSFRRSSESRKHELKVSLAALRGRGRKMSVFVIIQIPEPRAETQSIFTAPMPSFKGP